MGHIHFEDSDNEGMGDAGPSVAAAAPAPAIASAPTGPAGQLKTPVCCGSARVDFNFNDPCYVFRALPNPATGMVAASVSNNTIKLYQNSGPQLSLVGELRGHTGRITDLAFPGPSTSGGPANLVMSSSADGTVVAWDTRTGQPAERFQLRGQEVLSFSVLEHVVGAGSTGEMVFWDRRTASCTAGGGGYGKVLGRLDDTHAEDVTQVRFHPSGRVLSGSVDGLIAIHDVSHSFNDDDVFQGAININNSVEEFGLYGADGGRLWIRTGTESLHLWEWLRATREELPGGDMPFADWEDARGVAGQACGASAAAAHMPQVDYLVGCHYDGPSNQLLLMAGHNDGPVAFLPLVEQQGPHGAMAGAAMACPMLLLAGGHNSVVRSVHCVGDGTSGPLCVSGGEDALVCLWTLDQALAAAGVAATAAAAAAGGGVGAGAGGGGGGGQAGGGGRGQGGRGQGGQVEGEGMRRSPGPGPGPERQHRGLVGHQRGKLGGAKDRRPSPY